MCNPIPIVRSGWIFRHALRALAMIPDKGSIRRFARATGHNIISLAQMHEFYHNCVIKFNFKTRSKSVS